MMETNNHNNIEEQLWSYIDGSLPAAEKSVIDRLVETDAEWKAKYAELLQVHSMIQGSDLDEPSMRFTKNVMEEIAKLHIAPAAKSYINNRVIWGLGIFFIVMVVGFLIYGFGQVNWNEPGDVTFTDKLSRININQFFSNTWVNAFMMINVVLGLFLLDNYLSNKRKAYRKEA